jgi:hypothetical protein
MMCPGANGSVAMFLSMNKKMVKAKADVISGA